jgi:RNA polymerase sigma-70 factor, ECF subfamily
MSTTETATPTAFARFRAGDQHAFEDLVAEYTHSAYAVAVKVLGDSQQAEEAVQEAFLRIWRSAGRFDGSRGSERTWILSVVRNQSIDLLRRRNRHSTVDIDAVPGIAALKDTSAPGDPWRQVEQGITAGQIQDALDQLPAEQRGVIQLAFFGGMRSVDIARRFSLPEGTVRSRMRLGLARLRTHLEPAMLASP